MRLRRAAAMTTKSGDRVNSCRTCSLTGWLLGLELVHYYMGLEEEGTSGGSVAYE